MKADQIIVWTLTNTSSLNSATPAVTLNNTVVGVNDYAIPPKQHQPGSGTAPSTDVPQGHLHQRHHDGHNRGSRLLAPPLRR